MIPVALYGSHGHAREMHSLVEAVEDLRFLGWIDDDPLAQGTILRGAPIATLSEARAWDPELHVALAMGDGPDRSRLAKLLTDTRCPSPTLVHPRAHKCRDVSIGAGCQVGAMSVLSTDVTLGRHVIVNQGCSISHDVRIDDVATLSPGVMLSGAVTVERGAWLGTGAVVLPSVRIGAWSIVGAGAVVTRDVPPNTTVVGVPARVIDTRPDGWHLGSRPRRRNDLEAPR